jgi:two-component system, OmpR family, sensor kinase
VSRAPIRLRLTLGFAVVMAVVLAAMGAWVYVRVGDALLTSLDQTLRAQSADALAHVGRGERSLVDRDVAGGTTLVQLVDANGSVIRSTPAGLQPLLSGRGAAAAATGVRTLESISLTKPEGDWRVLAVRDPASGDVVVVARSLEPREESIHRLLRELMIAGPLALLLASLAGYGLAASALRPVEAMRRRAAAVTAATPARLPVPPSGDEISRLATTLNEMLARLESSLERERRFVADASHELRTPLALLRAELEIALRRKRTSAELEATLQSAAEETERLSRLAEDLLLIARADSSPIPLHRETVAADDVLETVAARFARRGERDRRVIRVEESDAMIDVDPQRLEQGLDNLVDNALAHGAGTVVLFARRRGELVELHVEDDGAGFPDEFLPRAFDRFSRADEARSRGGSGLGLSIVELIASAHGGTVGAANKPDGGADVWIALPAARHAARSPILS